MRMNIHENITGILEQPLSTNEKAMLDHFSTIDSLVAESEALALFHQRCILEIGSYRGGSTVAMGHAAQLNDARIFCIDKWSEYHEQSDFVNMDKLYLNDMGVLSEFVTNTAFLKDRLFMLRGDANTFSEILAHNLFSLVFIDGAHDYYSVVDDIISSLKVIEPGGILCGHDYHSAGIDVKKAVHDVIMQSETILIKGLVSNTSIWYAVIEDPPYELLLARTIKCMAAGDFKSAYEILAVEALRLSRLLKLRGYARDLKLSWQ
jgi:hypothetical protein